jgi:sodium/hydrogen antiporter
MIDRLSWQTLVYALFSLTVIRMIPVFLCLTGTGMRATEKLFIGWFGPRGLASIVFGIIVLNEKLPGNDILAATIVRTVVLSIVAHGVSANPLIKAWKHP